MRAGHQQQPVVIRGVILQVDQRFDNEMAAVGAFRARAPQRQLLVSSVCIIQSVLVPICQPARIELRYDLDMPG